MDKIKELEQTIQDMQVLIDVLWEFVSEKDVDKITKILEEHENIVE